MANFTSLLLLLTGLVIAVTANLEDDAAAMESELKSMDSKRQVKTSVQDVSAAELLDELKREVLGAADEAKLKKRFNNILKKKESEILSASAVKKDAKPATQDDKEASSDDDFFKALETRSDDTAKDPQAKRAMELMVNDLLTKEITDLTNGNQKRSANNCEKDPCCDKIKHCKFLSQRGSCETDKRMSQYCPKSCNFCKAPAPPKCSATKLGCCWDKITPKLDKDGKNCPECNDKYRYMCKTFKEECGAMSVAGEFMLQHCKKTCNFCERGCSDDLKMGFYCPFWNKDLNWCKKKKEMMLHYCPVTCGFC